MKGEAMTDRQFTVLRLDVAFWALLVLVVITSGWTAWAWGALLLVVALCSWRIERGACARRPGFWARVWGR